VLEREQQIFSIALLPGFAVHIQFKIKMYRSANCAFWHKIADGCRTIKCFGQFPGQALFFMLVLDIAGGKINPRAISS
jgi:hypothetical protein